MAAKLAIKVLVLGIPLATIAGAAAPANRQYEGDWYIADTTDNNTGEREVYAFQTYLKQGGGEFVSLKMRCSNGKPTFFIEWDRRVFPDQSVLTIEPVPSSAAQSSDHQYVFQKSEDVVEAGLRASPETSAKIIAALGDTNYATFTAHLSSESPMVGISVAGTQGAWARVSRHCPVRTTPVPPM